jgi:MoaA/NifB/PqqE/SkfB family radical SAM enzyme
MRVAERWRGLLRAPLLAWQTLVQGRYDFVYDEMPVSVRRMSPAKRWNLFRSGANLLHRRVQPWGMPLHMQFELTNFCNLRCPMCPTGSRSLERAPRAMELEMLERVLEEVGPYLLTATLWGWGESLLHPRLPEALAAVHKHPAVSLLSTNGQNLDQDRIIHALADFPPTYLIVAIDGLTDETNSKFRAGARLAPALSGVERLAAIKRERGQQLPVLHMRYIVMKHNQHELPRLEGFAREHRFDMLTIRTLSPLACDVADSVHLDYLPDTPEYRSYRYEGGRRVARGDFVCQQPFWFPTLFADGTVVGCEQDHNGTRPFGSVGNGASFREVWDAAQAARARKEVRDGPLPGFCLGCAARDRPMTSASKKAFFLNPQIPTPLVCAA